MAVNVYAWPPVALIGMEWTVEAPISVSRSFITGARYVSSGARERRLAEAVVPALGRNNDGAGYCEMLKAYLDGGANLVRLNSFPVNWHLDVARLEGKRALYPLAWETGNEPLGWTEGGDNLTFYTGTVLTGTKTTNGIWFAVTVTGLPPNSVVCRPAEYMTIFENNADTTGSTARCIKTAVSNASGEATIRLDSELAYGGRVNLGTSVSAVFEAQEMPRAMQPLGGNWSYAWSFREVFEDEVAGGFAEVDPWS